MADVTGPVLAEESMDRFEPLGVFGQPVHQSHIQLQAALSRRLGPRYANFFATPRFDPRGDRVSWVSPVEGDAKRWRDLSDEEQAARALDLKVMKSELEVYMTELRNFEGQGKDKRAASAFIAVLEQALKTPNDGYLYFVGDQPVSVFWGFREEETQPFETLTAAPRSVPVSRPTAAPPPSEDAPRKPFRWLWLLLPLLLFLIWWFWPDDGPVLNELGDPPAIEDPQVEAGPDPLEPLYFERDGVIVDRDGNILPGARLEEDGGILVPEGAGFVDEFGNTILNEEGEAVVNDVSDAATENPTDGDPLPEGSKEAPLEPEAAEPDAGDEGSAGDEGQEPEAPEVPEAPEILEDQTGDDKVGEEGQDPGDQDPPDQPSVDPGEAPTIPDNAPDGAAGFMQGDWRSDSGLVDGRAGEELTQEFRFDENGKGESIVRRSDGVTCRAPAEATVKDGNLRVEEKSNLSCSDGTSFKRSKTVCIRGLDGRARCRGVDADGKQFDVQLNRGSQP